MTGPWSSTAQAGLEATSTLRALGSLAQIRRLAWLAIALLGLTMLAHSVGCDASTKTTATEAPGQPQRIISVGGAVTEIVVALGAQAQLVAVDSSSLYPPTVVSALPKIGYQRALAAEGILALTPDLVVVSDEAGPSTTLLQLRKAGVRVVVVGGAATPADTLARIRKVGEVIARPSDPLISRVNAEIVTAQRTIAAARKADMGATSALQNRTQQGPSFVLIYARGAGTLMVSGTGTSGVAMLELAGGRNAITGFAGFKTLSAEALIAAAPDFIVVPSRGLASVGGNAGLLAVPGVRQTPAGQHQRIIAFDDLLLLGFGPRLGPALQELSGLLGVLETQPRATVGGDVVAPAAKLPGSSVPAFFIR